MFPAIIGALTSVAPELLKRLLGDKDAQETNIHDEQIQLLKAVIAEAAVAEKSDWWTRLWAGISVSVRPMLTYLAIALPAWAIFDPVRATLAFNALDLMPTELWIIEGTIFTFWFGSRYFEKKRKEITPEQRIIAAKDIQGALDFLSGSKWERKTETKADDIDDRLDNVDDILDEITRQNRDWQPHDADPAPETPVEEQTDQLPLPLPLPPQRPETRLPPVLKRESSAMLRNVIKEYEGFSDVPYLCPAGVWTIGWGHTKGVTKDHPKIDKRTAEEMLTADLRVFEQCVEDTITVPLQQHEFDALVSLAYNIGYTAFKTSEAVTATLNRGNRIGAADGFLKWNKIRNKKTGELEVSNGLTNRRERERHIFLKGWII